MTRWDAFYLFLVFLRIVLALKGYAYVHPDEFFQSTEVVAGDYFGVDILRAWEFDPYFPCRSLASIRVTSLPIILLARFSGIPSGRLIFATQRISLLCLSFGLDASMYFLIRTPPSWRDSKPRKAQCLLAMSSSVLTFQLRAFSNSFEAICLALCLVLTSQMLALFNRPHRESKLDSREKRVWILSSAALGGVFALGFFARFTFVAFVLPIALFTIHLAWRLASTGPKPLSKRARTREFLATLLPLVTSFIATSSAHIIYDTTSYHHMKIHSQTQDESLSDKAWSWPLVVTPLNALLYNLRLENLAQHGIHPRWLHAVINLPIIVGAAPVILALLKLSRTVYGLYNTQKPSHSLNARPTFEAFAPVDANMRKVYLWTILSPLILLSIQPHQEPRFLLPLVLPATLLFHDQIHSNSKARSFGGRRWRRAIFALFAFQQIVSTVFFGVLHQGGLVPALLKLNDDLLALNNNAALNTRPSWNSNASHCIHLAFWNTFMPPRHLLLPPSRKYSTPIVVTDYGNMASLDLIHELYRVGESFGPQQARLLIAPAWAVLQLEDDVHRSGPSKRLDVLYSFGPHLDMDHIGEMITAGFRLGWVKGLALEVRRVSELG